jgi:serine/threonine protein kinase
LAGKVIQIQDWRRDEMDILRKWDHQNIVKYIDVASDRKEVLLVTELLSSSLYDALRLEKKSLYTVTQTSKGVRVNQSQFQPRLTDSETFNILDGSFEGLRYLHNMNIMHRDISATNILLDVGYDTQGIRTITAKLCDFGLSKFVPYDRNVSTSVQNAFYSAPETQTTPANYSYGADVYSYGVVVTEAIMTLLGERKRINSAVNDRQQFSTIRTYCLGKIRTSDNQNFLDLVTTMTDEPSKRCNIQHACTLWKRLYIEYVDHDSHTEDDYGDINNNDIEVNEIDDDDNGQMDIDVAEDRNVEDNNEYLIQQINHKRPDLSYDEIRLFLNLSACISPSPT